MPVLFVAHGAPMLLDDREWMAQLRVWSQALPRPKDILMVSAHWMEPHASIGALTTQPLIHDFHGFEPRYYQTQYPAPGAPQLADRVEQLLIGQRIPTARKPQRGLDHGGYVPLIAMFPEAGIPVLTLSLPQADPQSMLRLGRALAPLREDGTLVIGSGFITHNMEYAFRPGTPPWAREFDEWVAHTLLDGDMEGLADFHARAPASRKALPTWEHYAPLLVAAGTAIRGEPLSFPITGFWMDGAFTKRSVQFG